MDVVTYAMYMAAVLTGGGFLHAVLAPRRPRPPVWGTPAGEHERSGDRGWSLLAAAPVLTVVSMILSTLHLFGVRL